MVKYVYVKRYVPSYLYYYIERNLITLNNFEKNMLHRIVAVPDFGPRKKPHYSFVFISEDKYGIQKMSVVKVFTLFDLKVGMKG